MEHAHALQQPQKDGARVEMNPPTTLQGSRGLVALFSRAVLHELPPGISFPECWAGEQVPCSKLQKYTNVCSGVSCSYPIFPPHTCCYVHVGASQYVP